jgi:hypothetical protein
LIINPALVANLAILKIIAAPGFTTEYRIFTGIPGFPGFPVIPGIPGIQGISVRLLIKIVYKKLVSHNTVRPTYSTKYYNVSTIHNISEQRSCRAGSQEQCF